MGGKDVLKIHICNAWDKGNKMKTTTQLKMGPNGTHRLTISSCPSSPGPQQCFPKSVRDKHNFEETRYENKSHDSNKRGR